ncbi:MAG TPA: S-layer homology domain-containing protein [Bacillota bacterium]|nr:S-layer homology domain-containing protein [Bacillota bacterium]
MKTYIDRKSCQRGWAFILVLLLICTTLFGGFGVLGIKGVVEEVYAADQPIAIDSTTLTQDNTTWAWDADTKTLTLKGINMSLNSGSSIYGIRIEGIEDNAINTVNVVVTGENVISGNMGLWYPSFTGNTINFSGTGSLTINSDQAGSMYFMNTTIDFQSGVYNLYTQSINNDHVTAISASNSTCNFNGATVNMQSSPYGQGYNGSFDPSDSLITSNVYINSGSVTINSNSHNIFTNNLVINGGTVALHMAETDFANIYTPAGMKKINGGQVKITGGNGALSFKNDALSDLTLTTLTLSGISASAAVSSLITNPELGYEYGTTDMKTDANGVIYAYLPAGKTTATVVIDDNVYTGDIVNNAATLTLLSTLTDITLTPVLVAYADRAAAGTKVADLAATGTPTSGITYSLDGSGSDNSLFQIVGTQLQIKSGASLMAQNYTVKVKVTDGTTSNTYTKQITFTANVTAAPTYTMEASTLTAFASQTVGYGTAPAAQTVTITNTGNQSITLTQPTSTNYDISTLSTTTLAVSGTATFTVQPKTGLAVGNHDETINITGSNSATTSVSAQFAVTAVPTYTMSASTLTAFASQTVGYGTAPAAQTVTITNTGNQSITLTQPTSTNYDISTLSTTTLAVSGTATFTVQPKTGLAVGNHDETISVTGTGGAAASISAQFAVTAVPTSSSSGGGSTPATTVINTNTGNVTGNQLNNAAKAAKDGEAVTIQSGKINEVTIPTSGFDALTGNNNSLTVVTDKGTLTFDSNAVTAMGAQATAADIIVLVEDVEKNTLTEEAQTKVGDKTVYDLSVMSGGKLISSFNGGTVTVSIPYELKTGEKAENLTVWYMADDGTLTEINCAYDEKAKAVTFIVNHFSKYVVGYDSLANWINPFADIMSSDWFYDAVGYVNLNGLMNGQTGMEFGPEAAMTRGMFVTILGRMENIDTAIYANQTTFSDVNNNQYYAPYTAWACDKEIVTGVGSRKFAPEAAITREQMAVMLTNYMKLKDRGPVGAWAIQLTYSDLDQISSWAGEGVMFTTMKELMKGTGNDANGTPLFSPLSTSTRAQTAQVMMNLEEVLK